MESCIRCCRTPGSGLLRRFPLCPHLLFSVGTGRYRYNGMSRFRLIGQVALSFLRQVATILRLSELQMGYAFAFPLPLRQFHRKVFHWKGLGLCLIIRYLRLFRIISTIEIPSLSLPWSFSRISDCSISTKLGYGNCF